jgi:tRNA C32,U32 (ribose-2'-O)-methylase TrmJ
MTLEEMNIELEAKEKNPLTIIEWITVIIPLLDLFKPDPRKKALRMLRKLRRQLKKKRIDQEEYDRLRDEILENV